MAEIEVETRILSQYKDDLANFLSSALTNGWTLVAPPVFSHRGGPAQANGHVVGMQWPHFLVIVSREKPAEKTT